MSISKRCRKLIHMLFLRHISQKEFDLRVKEIIHRQGRLDLKPKDKVHTYEAGK